MKLLSFSIVVSVATVAVLVAGCGRSVLDVPEGDAGPGDDSGMMVDCTTDPECDDGRICNGTEFCDRSSRTCRSTGPLDCPAPPDPCLASTCEEPLGCTLRTRCEDPACSFRPECGPCADSELDCFDGADNDCDGLFDCGDEDCLIFPECGPCADSEFECFDGIDNDCDGSGDCFDTECIDRFPECRMMCADFEFDCFDFIDNDCNGLIDCADMPCLGAPGCGPCADREFNCFDKIDNDCDGLADCRDTECRAMPMCMPCATFERFCSDGRDEDCDMQFDCVDLDCAMSPECLPPCEMIETACGDGRDEDCDGFFDCADFDCDRVPPCGMPCAVRETVCNDFADEDCDLATDCMDSDCAASPLCMVPCPEMDLGSRTGAVARGTTVGAPNNHRGTCGGEGAGEHTFTWTAPSAGTWRFDTVGSMYDPLLYIRANTCAGMQLGCDDDGAGMLASRIELSLMAGQRVAIFVDGWGSSTGNFVLNINPVMVCTPVPEVCNDARDNDCDMQIDCADFDCRRGPEICNNMTDDDCDGAVDCADPGCATDLACCRPVPEVCNDGRDNDCDRAIDCADPECRARPESCTNMTDDDCDGAIDCADSGCAMDPACMVPCPETDLGMATGTGVARGTTAGASNAHRGSCGGGMAPEHSFAWTAPSGGSWVFDTVGSSYDALMYIRSANCAGAQLGCDDDGAGMVQSRITLTLTAGQRVVIFVDGFGSSSGSFALNINRACAPVPEVCTDGVDNDCDMQIDCTDADCRARPENCTNRVDDDCDMAIDCRDTGCAMDPACAMMCVPTGTNEIGVAQCTNARDDDCDTRIDCADTDCSPFGPMGECCNGRDDDGDGQTDIFTCRCMNDAQCRGVGSLEQVCWTTTFSVCAPRCNFYGGDSFCRGLDPSLRCNSTTGECVPM